MFAAMWKAAALSRRGHGISTASAALGAMLSDGKAARRDGEWAMAFVYKKACQDSICPAKRREINLDK